MTSALAQEIKLTPQQMDFALRMTRDPVYEQMIDRLREGATLLFTVADPGDPAALQQARLLLTGVDMLNGMLTTWAAQAEEDRKNG